ncbi:MAG: sulfotransferase domain-containing protein [Synechococcus sp. ELA057]
MGDAFAELWHQLSRDGADAQIAARIEHFGQTDGDPIAIGLLRAELLRRQGRLPQAIEQLAAVEPAQLSRARRDHPQLVALHQHTWGLLQRENGHFTEAARAFIEAFSLNPGFLQSLHALQFTRLTPADLAALREPFRNAVQGCNPAPPLALQLLADWQLQLGELTHSCELSYRAAQRSVSTAQRAALDRLSPPSLPEALIIGAPKCGTTSLAGWLARHPQIYVHPRKELHFFDNRWQWGADWYRCQFPRFRQDAGRVVRLEATPNYLQLGQVPDRVHRLMPEARLIVLLRDPLQRALSWCQHIIRQEGVTETPESILMQELQELEQNSAHPAVTEGAWHRTNALFGSFYSTQLQRWQQRFREQRILILQMESTIRAPEQAWQRISAFLELDPDPGATGPPGVFPSLNTAPASLPRLEKSIQGRLSELLQTETKFWSSL